MKMQKEMQSSLPTQIAISPRVTYLEKESKPEANCYFFAYKMRIRNNSNSPIQLMSRHWVITYAHGESEEVRGAGVIGLQPVIQPGQEFEYESACPSTSSSCSMKGAYQMIVPTTNEAFEVPISEFYLIAPFALH
jgi:ApaG protein